MSQHISRCRADGEPITPTHVESVERITHARCVVRWVHVCGLEAERVMPWKMYEKLANRWLDGKQKAQKSYDTEKVGREVQGFRIELDAVETVADLEVLWDDQARHDRWSIPRERVA